MFVSRSSLLNPSPLLRFVRTSSPSRISTRLPRAWSFGVIALAIVDFPEPDKPVNQRVKPFSICGGSLKRKKNNEERIVRSDKSANNPFAGDLFSRLRTKDKTLRRRSTDCTMRRFPYRLCAARESGEVKTEQLRFWWGGENKQ